MLCFAACSDLRHGDVSATKCGVPLSTPRLRCRRWGLDRCDASDRSLHSAGRSAVRKRLFFAPSYSRNRTFTKTGSGQIRKTSEPKRRLCRGLGVLVTAAPVAISVLVSVSATGSTNVSIMTAGRSIFAMARAVRTLPCQSKLQIAFG